MLGGELAGHRDFRRLWAAQAISALGSRFSRTVLPLLAVVSLAATPGDMVLLGMLGMIPGIVVGLFLGGTIDRSRKRALMIGCDVARAVVLLWVPIAVWLDVLTLMQVMVVTAVSGLFTALFHVADNAYLPSVVPREHLVEGNSKLTFSESVAEITGPALGGWVMQLLGAPLAILTDAISYLASAVLLRRIEVKEAPVEGSARPRPWQDLKVGLGTAWTRSPLRPLLLVHAGSSFFGGFFFALYYLYCVNTLGLGVGLIGAVIGAGGIGALLGSRIAEPLVRRLRLGPTLIVMLALSELSALFLPAAAVSSSTLLVVVCLVAHQLLSDGCHVAYEILAVSVRQTVLPEDRRGRVEATWQLTGSALLLMGALVAERIASGVSVPFAVLVGVLGGLVNPVLLVFSRIPALTGLEELSERDLERPAGGPPPPV
ncbi:MAG: MFS transporter [Acidobacteriota bacterium]